jgi:ATP:ADP antiporter, AAA family
VSLHQQTDGEIRRLTSLGMLAASLLVGHQVAAKAARDGLFLARFPVTDLPKITIVAAVAAIAMGFLFSRLLSKFGPLRVAPAAVLASFLGHLAEYFLLDTDRGIVVTAVYLHLVGFGAILLSAFWSLANESFDARQAKFSFGRIAGAGTAGGILGGVLSERCVVLLNTESLLLLLATYHFLAFFVLLRFRSASGTEVRQRESDGGLQMARQAFERAPFLLSLALLVLLGTMSAALLDYLFKSGAAQSFAKGQALTRYFAIYYTASQVLTFLVQSTLTPIALERLGLGRTVMSLPLSVMASAGLSLVVPAFGLVASGRALESILRGSFFRSGYELFFTPIPPREKRAVKTVIDVGCDRFGDALGAGAVQVLLLIGPVYARVEILIVMMLLAAGSIWLMMRMDKAYVGVLENGLRNRAFELDINDVEDSTTMSVVMRTVSSAPREEVALRPVVAERERVKDPDDPVLAQLEELRSGQAERVRNALREIQIWEPLLAAQAIRLLAWDDVSEQAREALLVPGSKISGMLSDVLLDETQDFSIRRRIPRILARTGCPRAFQSLLEAQSDVRFEIRFQSSRAMDYLKQRYPSLEAESSRVLSLVSKELSVSRPIWEGRRLLDSRDPQDSGFSFLDDVLKERADQGLEHVFSLLAVILPREPLKIAFRAMHSEDRQLRGLGLEYLATTLPLPLFEQLTGLIQAVPLGAGRTQAEVLDELIRSGNSIVLELRKRGGDVPSPDGTQSTARGE